MRNEGGQGAISSGRRPRSFIASEALSQLGEGLLPVRPVTRSVTRLLTSDVSVVPLRLRRNAELRFVGHIATGRDTWDAVAGSKPSGRTWDLGSQVS